IGSGSESLIAIIKMLLGKGTVALENPGYPKTRKIYTLNNLDSVAVTVDDWGLNPAKIKDDKVSLIHVTPSHQFPTGTVMPVSRRLELLEWARKKSDRYIIEDDYDSEFRFAGKPIPALAGLEGGERVIYLNSFTKSIAPSLRISFMVLPKKLKLRLESEHPYYTCPVSLISQVALERFIGRGSFERHLNRMKKIYRVKRDYLISLLNELPFKDRFQIEGEEAGLHFLLKFASDVSETRLVESAAKLGVRVYGLDEYLIEKCEHQPMIIIGYSALSLDSIKKAIKILRTAWAWLGESEDALAR
ncbi:MAG: PLP-dependent aminotransferase family protein, partial [Acholeplasmataceae bacterium]|nr:PLP-dependent aminotransferase family protein [Acholeplasmataceae bacterium]